MYKACIFDMDGTVADTLSTISYYGNHTLKKFGFPEIEKNVYKILSYFLRKNILTET